MNWLKSFWKTLTTAPAEAKHPFDESMMNFSPRAQQVFVLARKEAERFNHNFVGTEHLLIGLIKLGQGVAVTVLQKLGLDLETVRMEVEKMVGIGIDPKIMGNIPYTPRVKKVLALAQKEAKALNHTYVGTEHILLGLLREGDGVAARVLKHFKVDMEQTRQEILKELDPNFLGEPFEKQKQVDPMDIKNLAEVPAFITKDGSEIRELLAHRNSAIRNQSLAEARLPVGKSTQEHYHPKAEEIYYITHGTGRIRIEGELHDVKPGDVIAILSGQKHKLWNTGAETLRLLCFCAPAYEHADTIITETASE